MFITQPVVDAPSSVPLFNWPVQVFFKPGVNYRFYRVKLRRSSSFRFSDFIEIGLLCIFFYSPEIMSGLFGNTPKGICLYESLSV